MKRLVAVLSSLLVLPAFAEVAPEYYYQELMAQYADEMPVTEFVEEEVATEPTEAETKDNTPVVPAAVSPRTATGRATTSRAITSATTPSARNVASRNVSNATTARTVSARPSTVSSTTTTTRPTTTASRSAVNRTTGTTTTARSTAATTVTNRPATTVRSTGTKTTSAAQQNLTTRASSTNTNNTARASIVQTDTVNTPLYVSSRVGVNSTSNVSTRVPTIRVGSTTTTTNTTESTSSATSIDELAQLTDYCKAQYTACMDNFCNVLDDNQGRCSCSANLSNYAETEDALKKATESLQDVAQQIQYIGLTSDEVESLFTQTEAELEMQTSTDSSQLKNSLDKIKDMIVEVQGGTSTSSNTGLSFDLSGLLDFSIDSTGFDLSSFLGMSSNTGSISNQRGEQLYKTATARCKASVLNNCSAQGVDINVITNSYDLEIDKACIAYERSLTESNDQMASTVRNAKSVLQRARLLVAQQKNAYDLRECVSELDNCMQDDFVCGDDYENCLDPTGKYIVNGEIVVGSEPGKPSDTSASIYQMWSYENGAKNAWTDGGTLGEYIDSTVTASLPSQSTTSSISEYLQNKIGYHSDSDGKNYGMCVSVLNKCQDITYTGTGQNAKYNPQNNVIKEYLNRTLVQIKAAQDTVLSDYAEDCITDVSSCLAQNNYNSTNPVTTTIAINACKSVITTCMSVNGAEGQTEAEWVGNMLNSATCPSGSKGTYPNCLCEGNKAYMPSKNECWACPEENGLNFSNNKPPSCKCKTGYTYDISTNKCVMSKTDVSGNIDDGDLSTP